MKNPVYGTKLADLNPMLQKPSPKSILLLSSFLILSNLSTACAPKHNSDVSQPAVVTPPATAPTGQTPVAQQQALGGDSSGGGASVVCYDSEGKISEAHFFDLFDAENQPNPAHRRQILRSDKSADEQIKEALARWTSRLEEKLAQSQSPEVTKRNNESAITTLQRALTLVERDWTPLMAGTSLPFVPDVKPVFLPAGKNCTLETTAHYIDSSSTLMVNLEIYNKLSPTDQAALKLHEAVYKIYRVFGKDKTSENTRLVVASLLGQSSDSLSLKYDLDSIFSADARESGIPVEQLNIFFGAKKLNCQESAQSKENIVIEISKVVSKTDARKDNFDLKISGQLWPQADVEQEFDVMNKVIPIDKQVDNVWKPDILFEGNECSDSDCDGTATLLRTSAGELLSVKNYETAAEFKASLEKRDFKNKETLLKNLLCHFE